MDQSPGITRKLTTILAADAANYSGRMAQDEVDTVERLRTARALIDSAITNRGGRIANTAGDGLIAEFPSVVEAVAAAVTIQRGLNADEAGLPFRIGIHLGDVIVEGTDLLGDGVNLAARLQEMAPEGGIFASQQVVDHAEGRLSATFRPLGPTQAKHLPREIQVFSILADGVVAAGDLAPVLPAAPEATKLAQREDFNKARKRLLIMAGVLGVSIFFAGPGAIFVAIPLGFAAWPAWKKWRTLRGTL